MDSTRPFGVEIEFCTELDITTWKNLLVVATGLPVRTYAESYSAWKLVEDGSVRGWELVSPILHGSEGIAQVAKMLKALRANGAEMDETCGFHVHVGASDFTYGNIISAVKCYDRNEQTIDRAVDPARRRSNSDFAEEMYHYVSEIVNQTNSLTELEEFLDEGGISRYAKLNICSYVKHGTIEFRQHEGTMDVKKATNWIRFCVEFMDNIRTFKPFRAPHGTKLRENSRIYKILTKLFNDNYGIVTKNEAATALSVSTNTVSSYMTHFRRHFPTVNISSVKGAYVVGGPVQYNLQTLRIG